MPGNQLAVRAAVAVSLCGAAACGSTTPEEVCTKLRSEGKAECARHLETARKSDPSSFDCLAACSKKGDAERDGCVDACLRDHAALRAIGQAENDRSWDALVARWTSGRLGQYSGFVRHSDEPRIPFTIELPEDMQKEPPDPDTDRFEHSEAFRLSTSEQDDALLGVAGEPPIVLMTTGLMSSDPEADARRDATVKGRTIDHVAVDGRRSTLADHNDDVVEVTVKFPLGDTPGEALECKASILSRAAVARRSGLEPWLERMCLSVRRTTTEPAPATSNR